MPKLTDEGKAMLAKLETAEKSGAVLTPKGRQMLDGLRMATGTEEPSAIKKTISNVARPVLEGGGAVAGALLAAPAAPLAGPAAPVVPVAGGALGYAAGKGAANRLDEALGLKEPPQGLGEGLKETEEGLREGLVVEAAGGIATRLLAGGAKAGSAVVQRAKELGIQLTPADIKNSKALALVESALEKIPWSTNIINRFRARQAEQLEKAAQDIIEQIGSGQSKEAVGTAAQDAIERKFYKRLNVRDKLFSHLTKSVPKNAIIATENLQAMADRLLVNESQLPASARSGQIAAFLDDMVKTRQQGLTFEGAKSLRERLNALIGPKADTPEKQVYKQVKSALDSDIAEFAEQSGGKILSAWRKANSFHGAVKQLADDPNIKSVLDKANPSAIVNSLMNSRNTLQLRLLKKAMPENAYRKVQDAFVDRLFEGGINQRADQALLSNLKKYGDEFLSAALPKEKLARIREFAEVAGRIKEVQRGAGNPSGTAQNLITMAQGAFIITNPVKGAVSVIAPPVMAKIYLSDMGKKLITEGISISPGSARAAGIASALLSLSKKENSR